MTRIGTAGSLTAGSQLGGVVGQIGSWGHLDSGLTRQQGCGEVGKLMVKHWDGEQWNSEAWDGGGG